MKIQFSLKTKQDKLKVAMRFLTLLLFMTLIYLIVVNWTFQAVKVFYLERKISGFLCAFSVFLISIIYSFLFSFRASHRVFRFIIFKIKRMPRLSFYKIIINENQKLKAFTKPLISILWICIAFTYAFYFFFA